MRELTVIALVTKTMPWYRFQISPDKLEMKQRSMSTPATPKQGELQLPMGLAQPPDAPLMMMPGSNIMDPYMRARTVRIGKWRWPPKAGEDGSGPPASTEGGPKDEDTEGFLEFKMRKMQARFEHKFLLFQPQN